ncbi:MAG: hypothetical protein K2L18_10330 [Acetatifactor sp.]|nr:hypothetical protein [Acetatifactor sp.]
MLRNIARKPIPKTDTYLKYGFVITEHEKYLCPRCKSALNAGPNYQPRYCDQCGQKINFTGIKWKEDKELGFAERRDVHEPVEDRVV